MALSLLIQIFTHENIPVFKKYNDKNLIKKADVSGIVPAGPQEVQFQLVIQ